MANPSVFLSAVKIIRTGADGGHLYLKGRGVLAGEGECDVYAYFRSKEDERDFESRFTGQSLVVESESVEVTRGIGGLIREILSWRFA